jgi:hypothetical protein
MDFVILGRMTQQEFILHACEQVLRFTRVEKWEDLSEERKVQLGFNMGVVALGLNLTKEEGFTELVNARTGLTTMSEFHKHLMSIITVNKVPVNEENIARPF